MPPEVVTNPARVCNCVHVVMPLGKSERDDQSVDVRDDSDDQSDREPRHRGPGPEDERRRDEQGKAECPTRPRMVARVSPEFLQVEEMSANLHRDEYSEE